MPAPALHSPRRPLLEVNANGLYCPAGDFYIDPWRRVRRAVITHAHGDHARWGHWAYLCPEEGYHPLRSRMGPYMSIERMAWGGRKIINGVSVQFYPAGHILGSAMVLVEHRGERWLVSGDYKTETDPTCSPWQPVRAHTFITECTFGLPIYVWPKQAQVFSDINAWWRGNQAAGAASVIYGYSLGKAQRILAGIDADIGPIYAHGAIWKMNQAYRRAGILLPKTLKPDFSRAPDWGGKAPLVVAPPSADGTPWLRRFGAASRAFASGWMHIRGTRRRKNLDRGFVLSDHVDWPSMLAAIEATGAERVIATHGSVDTVVRYLREQGYDAAAFQTLYGEEAGEE